MSDGCKGCQGCSGCSSSGQDNSSDMPCKKDIGFLKKIVDKHGGTIYVDPVNQTVQVKVPEENKAALVKELSDEGLL